MARRAVRHGHTGRVTFLPVLDLQTRGSPLPLSGFHLVGRGRRTRGDPECGEGPRCALPQVASWAPPQLPTPRPLTLGTMLVARGPGSGASVSCASRLARVPRPRTPPEAGLPPSDRPGSLTRTVLRTMVNKEQLFAAFDEWDSASYRPHSESSRRYSLWTRWWWASGPRLHSGPGPCAGHSCRRHRRRHHRARLARAGADGTRLMVGCSTGTNVC